MPRGIAHDRDLLLAPGPIPRGEKARRAARQLDAWGSFSFNGNLDSCLTIRTALLKDGKAYLPAGGGWVNDSEPDAEFQKR